MTSNQLEIVAGALVQWRQADTYGVVTSIENGMVHVQWDSDGCPPQFRAADAPLRRVDLLDKQLASGQLALLPRL